MILPVFIHFALSSIEAASVMLAQGVNTELLFANLYLKELDDFKFESYVHKNMKQTENGVTYIFITKKIQEKLGLTLEQASSCVSHMDSIKGSLIWIAFIETDENIRVRLRSRFVTISDLAEKYRGGGHACAAGSTLFSRKEIKAMLSEADEIIKKYKEENEGWM